MKKVLLSLASVLLLAVLFVSCNSGGPKANAEKFLTAFFHMDYAAAKEVSTEETKKQLDFFESLGNMATPSKKEEAKKIKVTVKDPKMIDADNATVEYTISDDPSPKTLKMVRVNGKWLAQWSKLDMRGMGNNDNVLNNPLNDTLIAPPAEPMPAVPGDTVMNK